MRIKKNIGDYLFLLPSIIILIGVTIYPIIYLFYLSLHKRLIIFDISEFVGIKNYITLFQTHRFYNSLRNTLYFTSLSVAVELILGLFIAILVNRRFKGKGIIRAIILIPWAIPTVVSAKMWEWLYNPDFGLLNYILGTKVNWLGSPSVALNAAIIMEIWKTTPFVALLLMAGLQTIPNDLYQAARVDGANDWHIFRRIMLPLLKPVIMIILLFRTLDAFRVFDAIYVLTGGGPANTTETLSIYAYKVIFQTLQFGYGSAISMVVFLITGMITIIYVRACSISG
ncbi:MAG: carbohydrate ABC transporter permease [Nitrospirota bacterium]